MKKIVLLFLSALAFVACDEGDLLENDRVAEGPKIVGFQSTLQNVSYFVDEGTVERSFPVKLVGYGDGQLPTSDINLEYEVDLVNSTATEGTEFDFPSSKTVTIPAGSDFGNLNLDVHTGQLNPTQKTQLILKLKPASGVAVSESQKTITIVFVGCSSQILTGNYTYTSVGGTSTSSGTTLMSEIEPNTFSVASGLSAGGTPLYMQFTDICGELTLVGWDYSATYLIDCSSVTFNPTTNKVIFTNLVVHNGLSATSPALFNFGTRTYTKI
ncbi:MULTISPECIES: hypothetical protein [Flavobacterium]|uniref:DUF1735 domain-containing protein n=1 Tax=Flavobacterium hankyongi TaxID=1176532 RepID=A0ABP8ZU47_9FLAO|nr:hypothetical protein [Flavobacterium sp. N1846]